jgi:hypothetical protein
MSVPQPQPTAAGPRSVPINDIRTDGNTQTRVTLDQATIEDYAAAYRAGDELPPVVAFNDGEHLWLADGFHRVEGAKLAGLTEIEADVREGTTRDALAFSAGSNSTNGLRRTNADKRRAVQLVLADKDWAGESDRVIAELCRVSADLVGDVRRATVDSDSSSDRPRKGKDGRCRRPPLLCKKCKRDGAKPRCTACKKARAAAKEKRKQEAAAKKAKPTEVKDDFGNAIPKGCLDAWLDAWIQEAFDALCVFSEQFRNHRLADGMQKRAKRFPFFNEKDFIDGVGFVIDYLDQLIQHLKTQRPAGVCPACGGQKCPECRHAGLVPRELYKSLKKGGAQ